MRVSTLEKPLSNLWANAQRYSANFYDTRYPICGQYLVYAVVGRKWVRVTPVSYTHLTLPTKA